MQIYASIIRSPGMQFNCDESSLRINLKLHLSLHLRFPKLRSVQIEHFSYATVSKGISNGFSNSKSSKNVLN